jgi:ankyrin repeat protein
VRLLKELLKNQINKKVAINLSECKNNLGETVLHMAAAHNNIKLIEYFLKESKYLKLMEAKTEMTKQTPLHYAAKYGCIDAVCCLINEDNKEVTDSCGRTPLYLAAEHGQEPAVKYLYKKLGCELGVINDCGQSALYWMVIKYPESVGLWHLSFSLFFFVFKSIFYTKLTLGHSTI